MGLGLSLVCSLLVSIGIGFTCLLSCCMCGESLCVGLLDRAKYLPILFSGVIGKGKLL